MVPFFTQMLSYTFQQSSDEEISEGQEKAIDLIRSLHEIAFNIRRLTSIGILRKGDSVTEQAFYMIRRTPQTVIDRDRFQFRVWPLIRLFRGLKATDPRDKVYASLPLVLPPNHPAFRPDYSLPQEEVYAQVVSSFIKYEGSLRILASCGPSTASLASFIPDWNALQITNELCTKIDVNQDCICRACRNTLPVATITKEAVPSTSYSRSSSDKPSQPKPPAFPTRLTLTTRGTSFDSISAVSIIWAPRSFRRLGWEAFLNSLPDHYSATNESLTCAYQRLLVADIRSQDRYELNGYTGTRLQKWAFWIEAIIEDGFRAWWRQEHLYEQSHSMLSKFRDFKTGKNWQVATTGARIDPMLDLSVPWVKRSEKIREEVKPEEERAVILVSHSSGVSMEGGDDESHHFGEATAQEKEKTAATPEIPDVLIELRKGFDKRSCEESLRDRIGEVTINRILCITENGYIGLVPQTAKVGDQVVVLHGGPTPFVLRLAEGYETAPGVGRESWRWQLVGEAYVHGIMDGEVMEMGLESEEFVLV